MVDCAVLSAKLAQVHFCINMDLNWQRESGWKKGAYIAFSSLETKTTNDDILLRV